MHRLGLTSVSTVEQAKIREAINAAMSRLADEGLAGLTTQYFVGAPSGASTITISTHSAGDSAIAFSSIPTDTRPGDVCEFSDGLRRLVYSLDGANIDFGGPIATAQTGDVTLIQRTIPLPTDGPVWEVLNLTQSCKVTREDEALQQFGLDDIGPAKRYTQHYDSETSYIVLWPVYQTVDQFAIRQRKSPDALAETSELDWPYTTLNAVLVRAIQILREWRVGGVSPIEADLGKAAIKDSTEASAVASPAEPVVRRRKM